MSRLLLSLACVTSLAAIQSPAAPVLLEGARLIAGDGAAPIESAALLVEKGRVAAIGRAGSVKAPAGARRVSLAGKTVMPALVDGHVHLGYQVGLSFSAENYTRATLVDQLNRYAYVGVSTVLSMGT